MKNNFGRRDFIKTSGLLALGSSFANPLFADFKEDTVLQLYKNQNYIKPNSPVRAVVLGAGNRGNVYASYSEKFPEELQIVGVAEPIEYRRKKFAERYQIDEKYQWITWEHALQVDKFADALIITTPDNLHYGPAMGGLALNYDLLLEKAIAQTWDECNDILNLSKKNNRIVAICHVLRYTTYFKKLKEIISSGALGELVSIQHFEPVEHVHMSHSFVRGNWRNTKESNPMLLSKSCHDLDILRWLIDKPCKRISSFGSLKHFKSENAPPGSTMRCTDGCKIEKECPYSALRIYLREKKHLGHLQILDHKDETILTALKNGQYGKCVYYCDNDVVDHQVVNMEFDGEITASFSMEAFTSYAGRRTRVMGTMGDIVGDMNTLTVTDFRTGDSLVWDEKQSKLPSSGHGGGDYGLAHDFVQAVSQQDPTLLTSTIEASMESHLMGFRAEESRLSGQTMDIKLL